MSHKSQAYPQKGSSMNSNNSHHARLTINLNKEDYQHLLRIQAELQAKEVRNISFNKIIRTAIQELAKQVVTV